MNFKGDLSHLSSQDITSGRKLPQFLAAKNILSSLSLAAVTVISLSSPMASAQLRTVGSPSAVEAKPLTFSKACEPGDSVLISGVGDFLFHDNLLIQAATANKRYISIWEDILPLFSLAQIRYGNLEGPMAPGTLPDGKATKDPGLVFDNRVYSGYPTFNYHAVLADDLKASGINVVSTANNHSLDRRSRGANLTIEHLDRVGIQYTGTKTAGSQNSWHTVVEQNGFKTAWLACTFSTNGIPDKLNQVLKCYEDTAEMLSLISKLSKEYDAVIVTPHWGEEYHMQPITAQTTLAKKIFDAGALAIIGTHPHVLEPWSKYVGADGKERFVIYSTGNFASGQIGIQTNTSVLVYLSLGKNPQSGTFIRGAGYVPLRKEAQGGRSWVRPLVNPLDEAPKESWATWHGHYGRANRIFKTDTDLNAKFCNLTK